MLILQLARHRPLPCHWLVGSGPDLELRFGCGLAQNEDRIVLQHGLGLGACGLGGHGLVAKHDLGAAILGRSLPDADDLGADANHFAVGRAGCQWIGSANVDGNLAGIGQDPEGVVGRHVLLAALLDRLHPGDKIVGIGGLILGRRGRHQAATTALDLRDREHLGLVRALERVLFADLLRIHRVDLILHRNVGELFVKLGHGMKVDHARHDAAGLQGLGGGVFKAGFGLHEGSRPSVEVGKPHRGQCVAGHILHKAVDFDQRVGDRRAGQEGHAPCRLHLDRAHLHIEVEGLLRSIAGVHAHDLVGSGLVFEVLELVRLVDGQKIDTHVLEVKAQIVGRPVHQGLEAFAVFLQRGGHVTDALRLLVAILLGITDRLRQLVDLLLHDLGRLVAVVLDEAQRRVANHDGVKVARDHAREQDFAVGGREIVSGGGQNMRAGIEVEEIPLPLSDEMVGHGHKRLARQAHAATFHDRGDRGEGLASADDMVNQRVFRPDHAVGSILLGGAQNNGRVGPDRLEHVLAVIGARRKEVDLLVEGARDQGGAIRVVISPSLKILGHLFGQRVDLRGRFLVDHFLAVCALVGDGDLLAGAGGGEDLQHIAARMGELRPILGQVLHHAVGFDATDLGGDDDLRALDAQAFEVILVDFSRNPQRPDRGRDLGLGAVSREHLGQGGRIFRKTGLDGFLVFSLHVAGEVFAGLHIVLGFGVEVDARVIARHQLVADQFRRHAGQARHVAQVDLAALLQADGDRIMGVGGSRGGCMREDHALGQDRRFLRGLGRGAVLRGVAAFQTKGLAGVVAHQLGVGGIVHKAVV